jgi:hypothetical protein
MFSFLYLIACRNDGGIKAPSTYKPYDGTARALFYIDTIPAGDYTYEIYTRGGMMDASAQVVIREDGDILYNKDHAAIGRISGIYTTDLDGDGKKDLVFYTNTEDATHIGNAYAVINKGDDSEFKYILPFMPPDLQKGYFGRDSFYVKNHEIIRRFPIYDLNQYNQKRASGKFRYITYTYQQADTLSPQSHIDQ